MIRIARSTISTHAVAIAIAASFGFSCSHPSASSDPPASTTATAIGAAPADNNAASGARVDAPASPAGAHPPLSSEKFEGGARAFETAKAELLSKYVDPSLTEDRLYAAAVRGMLEYADPKMTRWNALLSPAELAAIQNDLHGEIVGIGVKFEFQSESGYSDVIVVIPGSPAERAGLLAGDRIITVDGHFYKGKTTTDVAAAIRGKAGEVVSLSILRDDKMLTIPVQRASVGFDPVAQIALPGSIAYVKIASFTEKTAASFRAALEAAAAQKSRGVVVDLRHNPGGLFDAATECAGMLVPTGSTIVLTRRRDGHEDAEVAKGPPLLGDTPLAILVDDQTASGAELVTAALRASRHAPVIGGHTFGKWSVQRIEELGNGFAMKYTASMFEAPDRKSYEGVGLSPDVEVSMDARQIEKAQSIVDPEKRLAADAQLRTAVGLIQARLEGH